MVQWRDGMELANSERMVICERCASESGMSSEIVRGDERQHSAGPEVSTHTKKPSIIISFARDARLRSSLKPMPLHLEEECKVGARETQGIVSINCETHALHALERRPNVRVFPPSDTVPRGLV